MTILDIFDNTTMLASNMTEREEVRVYLVKCRDMLAKLAPTAPSPADVTTAFDVAVVPSGRARRKLKLGDAPTRPVPPVDPPGIRTAVPFAPPEVRLTLLAYPGARLIVEVLSAGTTETALVQYGPAAEPSSTATKEQIDTIDGYDKAIVDEIALVKSYLDKKGALPDSVPTSITSVLTQLNTLVS